MPRLAVPRDSELLPRAQQIKELLRLGNMLRAELSPDEVLEQMVKSITSCTGFRSAVINLLEDQHEYLTPIAFAGVSDDARRLISANPVTIEQMYRLMQAHFRISQSYFIPHEHSSEFEDIPAAVSMPQERYTPGGWHPEDFLMVPLYSPRKDKLLGFLSLDDPVDGQIPSIERIEMLELFANQAAIAIDNARIFSEREAERLALEHGIEALRRDLERLRRGDLRVQVQSAHEKLQPVVEAVNAMIEEISEIVGSVQMVTRAVDEHAQDVRRGSDVLVHDTSQQERQVGYISQAIDDVASAMKLVAERAQKMSKVAAEAIEVTNEGQQQVDRANEGMRQVRDVTMQSARVIKRLGERGQEMNDSLVELTDLTTRMNLLALNAAIEAVRAGEQGQGFAVIAQEIRTLAVNSAEAARKVSARLRAIQGEVATVSQGVDQNIQQVVMQSELAARTGVALDAIGVVMQQMADLAQSLDTATGGQSQGSQLVVHSVEEILRMASEIAQQSEHMKQSMAHLVELTNALRKRLSILRINGH
jgi:methyl-accepting chemotaxis protein